MLTDFDYYEIMCEVCKRCTKNKELKRTPANCPDDCKISNLVWEWLKGENEHEEKSER